MKKLSLALVILGFLTYAAMAQSPLNPNWKNPMRRDYERQQQRLHERQQEWYDQGEENFERQQLEWELWRMQQEGCRPLFKDED